MFVLTDVNSEKQDDGEFQKFLTQRDRGAQSHLASQED